MCISYTCDIILYNRLERVQILVTLVISGLKLHRYTGMTVQGTDKITEFLKNRNDAIRSTSLREYCLMIELYCFILLDKNKKAKL